ncbi:MAG: saccharopine dehydrogenase family protein [Candidatus Aureabacteria bacterium]|nr:saccharopine dehydrogenase family protein [Candidatus Auribacterota bacterium]
MSTVLIIGTGGVGRVVAHKCNQVRQVFSKIVLANRTLSKAEEVKKSIGNPDIETVQLDANETKNVITVIRKYQPNIVIHTALPYQDLSIMEACLQTGVDYLDTANYESPDKQDFNYNLQWKYHERFKEKGIMALLGSGFDPGVTNVFIAHAKKNHFDKIVYVDIMDCNGGDHGQPFATNFNPEINIREITQKGKYYEDGEWKFTPPLSVHRPFDFPGVGAREMYLMYHEEEESLVKNFPEIKRIRFWMTFSENYLNHLRVLQNVGMTSIEPVDYRGLKIIPLRFLKAVLPDPGSLGPLTKGKTCIGCLIQGYKNEEPRKYYIYNICDHEACYREVGAQAISYTTGVPAMIGAKLMLQNTWREKGVFNLEQLDPQPFLEDLNAYGLPWEEKFTDQFTMGEID